MSDRNVKLLTIEDIKKMPEPTWLLADLIPERGFVELYGPPKNGKSFIGLDWGLSIAAGIPWFEHKVKQGPVVYIYAETPSGLKLRVPAWCKAHGVEPKDFFAVPTRLNISDGKERDRLVKQIKEQIGARPVMIVIDTLAKCFGPGDENSNKDMGVFVDGCETLRDHFDCAVLVVHHAGKDLAAGSRGGTALPGAVDAQFQATLRRSDGRITLKTECIRDGVDQGPIWLKMERCLGSMVLVQAKPPTASQKEPTNKDKVKAALAQHMPNGATSEHWKDAAVAKGVKERSFYQAKKDLLEAGEVDMHAGSYFLAERAEVPDDVMSCIPSRLLH